MNKLLKSFVKDHSEGGKPLGGDGSNGTTEIPIVDDRYSDQPKAFWPKLPPEVQAEIARAWTARYEAGESV